MMLGKPLLKKSFFTRNNIKAGLYKIYHENGEMWQTGSFVDEKLDSTWLIYHQEGFLEKKINYQKGLCG